MRGVLLLTLLTTLIFFVSVSFGNTVLAATGNLKYYGYFESPPWWYDEEASQVSTATNIVFVEYKPERPDSHLKYSINYRRNQGYNIILSVKKYFHANHSNQGDWEHYLTTLKTRLENTSTYDKIDALYLADEPESTSKNITPEQMSGFINLTKEAFPDKKTLVIFFNAWHVGRHILNNPNLDIIGIDPYFLSKGWAENNPTDAYKCNAVAEERFEEIVHKMIYWVKTGGNRVCNGYPYSCGTVNCTTEKCNNINNTINSDTDKKIILVGQSFMCNKKNPTWNISQIPSICQQEWYYDRAKADPDIIGLFWYTYSWEDNVNKYYDENEWPNCVGVGIYSPYNTHLIKHRTWGLEVLCQNHEHDPFCATNNVSYENADQAKCAEKEVTGPGGSGTGTCDSSCGAAEQCHGEVPGIGFCDENCNLVEPSADINNDTRVDLTDLGIVTSYFGLTNSDPGWNKTADVAHPYGEIDIFDAVFVAGKFT